MEVGCENSYVPRRKKRRVCCQRDQLVVSVPLELPIIPSIGLQHLRSWSSKVTSSEDLAHAGGGVEHRVEN